MPGSLANELQFQVDKSALALSKNGLAAISFLRKSASFSKEINSSYDYSRDKESPLKLRAMMETFGIGRDNYDGLERIKSIMTLMALDEYQYLHEGAEREMTPLPVDVCNEVQLIHPPFYFQQEFDKIESRVKKIEYLISCLPELRRELIPYELNKEAGIRVRHFCHLLRSLVVNLDDPEEFAAVDRLVEQVCHTQTPGLHHIYFAIQANFSYKSHMEEGHRFLTPLGPFKALQHELTRFVEASTIEIAMEAAKNLQRLRVVMANHLEDCSYVAAYDYIEKYKKTHGKLPTGQDRYYGSNIGKFIKWSGFSADEKKMKSWQRHIEFAKQDSTFIIAYTLWDCGVVHDQSLWPVFTTIDFLKLIYSEKYKIPFTMVEDENGLYYQQFGMIRYERTRDMQNHLRERYDWNNVKFEAEENFIAAFNRFYDDNWFALIQPHFYYSQNADNPAVHMLLEKFAAIATSGSDDEKQVVKDFFLASEDKRSLKRLLNPYGFTKDYGELQYGFPYVNFIVDQEYKGTKFNLFSVDEVRNALRKNTKYSGDSFLPFDLNKLPFLACIKLYGLPYQTVSLDCLEVLLPLIDQDHIGDADAYFEMYFATPIKAFSPMMLGVKRFLESTDALQYKYLDPKWFDWTLTPGSHKEISTSDLAYLYRYYDSRFLFPIISTKIMVGELVIKEVDGLIDLSQRIDCLEILLFTNENKTPLSDMYVRTRAIELWVAAISSKYGKDDNSEEYKAQIIKIIDHVLKSSSKRDCIKILNMLAISIESQWLISEYLGEQLEAEKFLSCENNKSGLGQLAELSQWCSNDKVDQQEFLEFLSSPFSLQSLNKFTRYVANHRRVQDLQLRIRMPLKRYDQGRMALQSMYFQFWDCTLEQRAVLIDHILIPASKVVSDADIEDAYVQGYTYIASKLFPDAEDLNSDDHFIKALNEAYLRVADKYLRPILLAGMLVATNEIHQAGTTISTGKKMAHLCEHMGPAYIKLAQALHSHPSTPAQMRSDLEHIKGRANPPYRWQLWRIVQEVVPLSERRRIKRIGRLLGSASYNLALEVEMTEALHQSSTLLSHASAPDITNPGPTQLVLLLLRENAKRDAEKGFAHLRKAVLTCQHPRMIPLREVIISIIDQAKESSEIEMDKDKSAEQYQIASRLYANRDLSIQLHPVRLINHGFGYRFIERVYGEEFNDLPTITPANKLLRERVARAVVEVELVNILSCGYFDSDRHGNQLRVELKESQIKLGLYDFGEMSLSLPQRVEIQQLVNLIDCIPSRFHETQSFPIAIESLLADHIQMALRMNQPIQYLMRARKAFLALQDFQRELSQKVQIEIFKKIVFNELLHPEVRKAMLLCIPKIFLNNISSGILEVVSFFRHSFTSIGAPNPEQSEKKDSLLKEDISFKHVI